MSKIILIVDDSELLCKAISNSLNKFGWETYYRCFPEEVDKTARAYDLIITDYLMPKLDGIKLSHKIKKVAPNTKVIIMSGRDVPNEYADNVVTVFSKPFDLEELHEYLLELFDIKS